MANLTIDQEMLECFSQLTEAEKSSVVNLLDTFIKSKQQLSVINFDQTDTDSIEIDEKTEIKIPEPKTYYSNSKKDNDKIAPTWW